MGKKTEELEKMIVTVQKIEMHNQVLLMRILSVLGVEDDDIEELNTAIAKNLEEIWEERGLI